MKPKNRNAFTMIEMIVTLAVITAIVTALAFSFVKRLDRIAGEEEAAALRKIGTAFKESVKRSPYYVPDHTTWAATVAAYLGWENGAVTVNGRKNTRAFLVDPTMQIDFVNGTPALPYTQDNAGSQVISSGLLVPPQNTRFLILSSVGKALGITTGLGATSGANAFHSLWAGNLPSGWTAADAKDLKVERIDLSDLFVKMSFVNADTTLTPSYGIEAAGGTAVNNGTPLSMYFIKGSELNLYPPGSTTPEYSEIVYAAHDFTFERGTWRGKPFAGRTIGEPTGEDLERAMDMFMNAPLNPNRKFSATQQDVYDAMVDYMEAFIDWRDQTPRYEGETCPGPVANNTRTAAISAARALLSDKTSFLINRQ